jgi:hypothetical protein
MWLKRIFSTLLGIRNRVDLEEDLKNVSLPRLIILFITINFVFISIIITITNLLL